MYRDKSAAQNGEWAVPKREMQEHKTRFAPVTGECIKKKKESS